MAVSAQRSRYQVQGMDCAGCVRKIDTAVRRLDGIDDVSISLASGTMTVSHVESDAVPDAIARQVRKLGYGLVPVPAEDAAPPVQDSCCGHDHDHADHGDPAATAAAGHSHSHGHNHSHAAEAGPWWRQPRTLLTGACGAALGLAFVAEWLWPAVGVWAFGLAMLIGLVPVARRAIAAALAGTPFSIEMLMTIAAVGAVVIGATEEAAAVVFLFLVGEWLEGVAAGRARASIRGLGALLPRTAQRRQDDGTVVEVPAERLAVGDTIIVRPGDRIAADGTVTGGIGAVNEAPVTGESTPRHKEPGDRIFAGSVNGDAVLQVRVSAAAQDNTIARIVKLVEEAQESKAPTERFLDRFATVYTPAVVLLALLVAVVPPLLAGGAWDVWIYRSLALLLIGCPCALVISTPAAIAAALAAGARRGLLMKGGAVLEEMGRLQTIAFDKTGTLTRGQPVVTDIVGFDGESHEVLRRAAALEAGSSHPLARAILARAAQDGIAIPAATGAAAIGGKGVVGTVDGVALLFGSADAVQARHPLLPKQKARIAALAAEGKTVSVLLAGNTIAGAIALRDEPRDDAVAGLRALRDAGIDLVMLTGDNARTAAAIGRDLEIEVRAGLLPEDKQRIVGELKAGGRKVGKVGDGINDAPALAAADIGIAMGDGTDVALETADAAILHGRVSDIPAMIALSRLTMANIRQNIAIALGLKAVFLVTTVLGVTGLWPAILADTGATVLVTANAMRLLAWKPAA